MKKKNLLLMLLAVMALLLIPVSVQAAAAKPGTVKLSKSTSSGRSQVVNSQITASITAKKTLTENG